MPDCGGSTCSCKVVVGPGLEIEGSGSLGNPYVISLGGTLDDSLRVEDTTTVDLVLDGGGTPADPYRLKANARMRVQDLIDVIDPEGGPSAGDSLVWVTAGVDEPRWEFRPPAVAPAGAVNVGVGILGVGSVGDPIKLNLVSETPGSTSGAAVYVDTNGDLRVAQSSSIAWSSVTDKPTSFPTTPSDFSGVLPASKGGTGQSDLSLVTVGNALKLNGRTVYVQSSTPSGAVSGDLWFW